jgi:hypothetical protein
VAARKSNSPTFLEYGSKMTEFGLEIGKTGTKMGNDALPLFGTAVGAVGGAVVGVGYGVVGTAGYFAEKSMDIGGHIFEKSIEDGKDVYKVTLESGTQLAIEAGSGAMSVIKQGMSSADDARKELKDFAENMVKVGADGFGDIMHTTADAVEN